jgi:branched-subunit amino acid ABC-type transport system permease component
MVMRDAIGLGLGLLIFAAVVLGGVVGATFAVVSALGPVTCASSWPDRETEFHVLGGCLVEHNGEFIPARNVMERLR